MMALDLPRYLLGAADVVLLAGFATLGAAALRSRLLPGWSGAPAHLATAVGALALLIWTAELLGVPGLFKPLHYLFAVAAAGAGLHVLLRSRAKAGWGVSERARRPVLRPTHPRPPATASGEEPSARAGTPHPAPATLVALLIAAAAFAAFAAETRPELSAGMTGFDSTWYHGPLAAAFFQTGSTWDLHFLAPQFLAWFYPANAELFHAVGMAAFDRDVLSPLLNLAWLAGCLAAAWCIGRPFGAAPWSLALAAVALSVPAFADQAGEARNDIVGAFFLLSAVAIALNAASTGRPSVRGGAGPASGSGGEGERGAGAEGGSAGATMATGPLLVAGLAIGLAAGTKLNFLVPAAALVPGLAAVAPTGSRRRALAVSGLAALAGGGYWYLRNLLHAGNPLPWVTDAGPVSLPGPEQELGGREGHSVLGYLLDGSVWSEWFLPGLADGLTFLWPLLLVLALAGLLLSLSTCFRCSFSLLLPGKEQRCADRGSGAVLAVAGLTGLATVLAWLIAPTSASGPAGMPRGFESGLRYLVPALALGLALLPPALSVRLRRADMGHHPGRRRLPAVPPMRPRSVGSGHPPDRRILKMPISLDRHLSGRGMPRARALTALLIAAIALGYPVQRHYLQSRYADPAFAAPGLNAAFAWARDVSGARIATTATREYPLLGTDLSNRVAFVGEERPHGGFVPPETCRAWRRLLAAGDYDYVVASRDRVEPGKPRYPASAGWTESPSTIVILRKPPTVVFELSTPPEPSACGR